MQESHLGPEARQQANRSGDRSSATARDAGIAQELASLNELLKQSGVLNGAYRAAAAERAMRISELIRENDRLASEVKTLRASQAALRRQLKAARTRLRKTADRERTARKELEALASRRSVRAALRLAALARPRAAQPSQPGTRR